MGRNKTVTTYWVVVTICCSLISTAQAADTLDAIGLSQQVASSARNGSQLDADRTRSRIDGHPREDSLSTNAQVDCFDSTSDVTTLLQDDLARVTFDLTVNACRNPAANGSTTVGGSAQLEMGINRTSRKVVSLSQDSSHPVTGVVSLQRLGDSTPAWQIDLAEQPLSFELAFAIELAAGDYLLDVSATETTRRDHSTDLRVSVVNRGDVNGNERFDSADLAVVDAILNQDVYVVAGDLDDDGDNDSADRRLWTNGLKPRVIPSLPLFVDGDRLPEVLEEDEPEIPVEEPALIASVPNVMGDIDGDGEVDFADFLEFSQAFGPSGDFNQDADFDNDGSVDFPDFLVFTREFGSEGQSALAPEPHSPTWLIALALSLLFRVSRKLRSSSSSTLRSRC